jgi:hypothetical protein
MKQESQDNVQATHVEISKNNKEVTNSGDIANQLVGRYIEGNITPQLDKQCLRRIDLVLMPVMFLSFALQYLDKACLTAAALFGILEDLDLLKL